MNAFGPSVGNATGLGRGLGRSVGAPPDRPTEIGGPDLWGTHSGTSRGPAESDISSLTRQPRCLLQAGAFCGSISLAGRDLRASYGCRLR